MITSLIDIDKVKRILSVCPYYDDIINYEVDYNDEISVNLIEWYKDLIFESDAILDNETKILSMIDKSMYLYVSDNKYRRGLKKRIDIIDISLDDEYSIKNLIKKIINFTNDYENLEILNITSSKWL